MSLQWPPGATAVFHGRSLQTIYRCLAVVADGELCANEARYFRYDGSVFPDYCGIHDITHNDGRGKLARELGASR
jgi:hypothetical protein